MKEYSHPDYLGNTEFITDRTGRPYQHFFYSPFGEELVSQHAGNGNYDSPYRFNAKEVDPETGMHYYGARYYNSNLSVWLSVDPLADKYPSLSPYLMVANNPVMLYDPDGMRIRISGKTFRDRMQVRKDIRRAKREDANFKKNFKALKKSEETYVFEKVDGNGGGGTTTDGENILINYSEGQQNSPLGVGPLTSLLHETEHAVQFENGEFGFAFIQGSWRPSGLDIGDELKAFQAGSTSPESRFLGSSGFPTFQGLMLNIGEGIEDQKVLNAKADFLLSFFQNQPDVSYHSLQKTNLNNNVNERTQNDQYFFRPYSGKR